MNDFEEAFYRIFPEKNHMDIRRIRARFKYFERRKHLKENVFDCQFAYWDGKGQFTFLRCPRCNKKTKFYLSSEGKFGLCENGEYEFHTNCKTCGYFIPV